MVYEYQTMMTSLMALDVANASLYEGASVLAEAVQAAARARKKVNTVLIPRTINPVYRKVVENIVRNQDIELVDIPFSIAAGTIDIDAIRNFEKNSVVALVIPQPNYFGVLEDVDALTDLAHELDALAIGLVNPTAMALLRPA